MNNKNNTSSTNTLKASELLQKVQETVKESFEKEISKFTLEITKKQEKIHNNIILMNNERQEVERRKEELREMQKKINNSVKYRLEENVKSLKRENEELNEQLRQIKRKLDNTNNVQSLEREKEFYKRTCFDLIESAKNRMNAYPSEAEKDYLKKMPEIEKPSRLFELKFMSEKNPNLSMLNKQEISNIDKRVAYLPISCYKIDIIDN